MTVPAGRCPVWGDNPPSLDPPATPQTAPEIQRTSLVAAVLYLKSLPLDIDVLGFDYLDRPAVSACCARWARCGHAVAILCMFCSLPLASLLEAAAAASPPFHRAHPNWTALPPTDVAGRVAAGRAAPAVRAGCDRRGRAHHGQVLKSWADFAGTPHLLRMPCCTGKGWATPDQETAPDPPATCPALLSCAPTVPACLQTRARACHCCRSTPRSPARCWPPRSSPAWSR